MHAARARRPTRWSGGASSTPRSSTRNTWKPTSPRTSPREMLAKDPALRAAFEQRARRGSGVREEPAARLDFFYRRHPSWDERHNLYPVYRTATPCPSWIAVGKDGPDASCRASGRGPARGGARAARLHRPGSGAVGHGHARAGAATAPIDGRLLLLISTDADRRAALPDRRPARRRSRSSASTSTAGGPARRRRIDADVLGYPRASPARRAAPASTASRRCCTATRRSGAPTATSSSCRWIAAKGSSGTARRATCTARRRRSASTPAARRVQRDARSGDPADRRSADDEVHHARADPERAADEVLGPADVPRRARPACPRASTRTRTRAIRW